MQRSKNRLIRHGIASSLFWFPQFTLKNESIIIRSSDPVHLHYHCYQSLPSLSLTLEWPFAHMFISFFGASESIFSVLEILRLYILQMRASLLCLVVIATFAAAAHKKKGHREVCHFIGSSLWLRIPIFLAWRENSRMRSHCPSSSGMEWVCFNAGQQLNSIFWIQYSNLQEIAAAIHCPWGRFRNIWRRRFVGDTHYEGIHRKWRNKQWFQIPGVYVHSLRLGDNFVSVGSFRISSRKYDNKYGSGHEEKLLR